MPNSAAESRADLLVEPQSLASSAPKPVIIGLYGVSGCGKSYLLDQLKRELDPSLFKFYEGSDVISSLIPGGLDAFHSLEEQDRVRWRQLAIDCISRECFTAKKVGLVAGHYMFWNHSERDGRVVCTTNDMEVYTHILYLDVEPEVVSRRRSGDATKNRSPASVEHLRRWQEAEKIQLRQLCRDNDVLFTLVSPESGLVHTVSNLVRDFQHHTESVNISRAVRKLDEVLADFKHQPSSILIFDADRTLIAEDTGALFWKMASEYQPRITDDKVLREVFSSKLAYSYIGFRQATLLYEEAFCDEAFDLICDKVASAVVLRPEFSTLLRLAEQQDVGAVVITCGLRRIWDKILENAGLSKTVKVVGGGRIADGFVITPEVKASLVLHLQTTYKLHVWAFGDSPLDLPMLAQADEAIVVVGEAGLRSKSMDAALLEAIDNNGFRARQSLLSKDATPRLDTQRLPLVNILSIEFINSVFSNEPNQVGPRLRLLHATTKKSAKILMTPMRNATIAGPNLREAHERAGWYLAIEFLTELIGDECYSMKHVQGNMTSGHRLLYEEMTLIVPLMRGGESMAFGINQAFPLARFVHARHPDDFELHHLQNIRNIILVDSVINSGATVVEFARRLRRLDPRSRIIVVAGVVQDRSVSKGGQVYEYGREEGLELVALRLSSNQFIGSGGTDTGNRLFNTTHLS